MRTWIPEDLCYLTIKSDTGQHSQFLRCFFLQRFESYFGQFLDLDEHSWVLVGLGWGSPRVRKHVLSWAMPKWLLAPVTIKRGLIFGYMGFKVFLILLGCWGCVTFLLEVANKNISIPVHMNWSLSEKGGHVCDPSDMMRGCHDSLEKGQYWSCITILVQDRALNACHFRDRFLPPPSLFSLWEAQCSRKRDETDKDQKDPKEKYVICTWQWFLPFDNTGVFAGPSSVRGAWKSLLMEKVVKTWQMDKPQSPLLYV